MSIPGSDLSSDYVFALEALIEPLSARGKEAVVQLAAAGRYLRLQRQSLDARFGMQALARWAGTEDDDLLDPHLAQLRAGSFAVIGAAQYLVVLTSRRLDKVPRGDIALLDEARSDFTRAFAREHSEKLDGANDDESVHSLAYILVRDGYPWPFTIAARAELWVDINEGLGVIKRFRDRVREGGW